jgi:osmotically-inducible protein OsmY
VKVIDGTALLSGRVENAEDKLKLTKFAWETAGIKAVRNDIVIADESSFKQRAKDILITSQLNVALLTNKKISYRNYNMDTINGKIYIYGMARTSAEMEEVIKEAKLIPDVVEVVPSIILSDNLSRKNYL